MKSAALVPFAILFSSIALPAQSASQGQAGMEGLSPSQASAAQASVAPMPRRCPVSMRAQHGAAAGMLQADKGRPKGLAQLLHLTLINPDLRQIVSASVRVHGLSGAARVTQTVSGRGSGDADAEQTLVVRFSSASGKTVTSDLWVPAMSAVLTIDLNSITFADGTTRNFAERDGCHVAPDPLMLIAGH